MKFLTKKWPLTVNAVLMVLLVMAGLYLFNARLGFADVFGNFFDFANETVAQKEVKLNAVNFDWLLGMLLGVFLGGICGALIDGCWKLAFMPESAGSLTARTGQTVFGGIAAGFLIMSGCLLAGETFFGQYAGAMELSPGSWMFLIVAIASAGATALFIERRQSGGKSTAPKGGSGNDK